MKKDRQSLGFLRASLGASLIASAVSVGAVAVVSLLLLKQTISMDAVPYVNTGLKVICSAVAALLAVLRAKERVLLRSVLAGVCYMAVSFLVFSLVTGSFSLSADNLYDLLICAFSGAVVGIVKNLRS